MTAYRTKGTVSEDDVYALVQRYGAATVFTLLQEISQTTEKDLIIDWRVLVKTTSTGITNAREYQMLWRHLAYGEPLEKVDDGDELLSDESDLEYELEATSTPGIEASTEVDYYVKVLLSSGLVGDSAPAVASSAEAPTSDMPNDQASVIPSDKQQLARLNRTANGTATLHAQKHPLLAGLSNEALDGNGSSNSGFPPKKKRKLWSQEEDMELIAAVEKFGEGNWANILKGEFKHDRTASQLSQRWAIIRKRQANSNQSTGNKSRSEEMLAAKKAFSMALNMPMSGSLSTIHSAGGTQMQITSSSTCGTAGALDASQTNASQALKQNQQPPSQEMTTPRGAPNPSSKPRATQKKPPAHMKATICPNPSIKAAAFAAGGRIATPSTAASLLKAAQSKNAVRIRHGGSTSLPRSSVTSIISSPSTAAATSTTTATITGSHALRFIHPSAVSQVTGGSLITSKLGQLQGNSVNASSLPSSASMQMLSSELKPAKLASCSSDENAERRLGIIISAVDVDELLAEEVRGAQERVESDVQVKNTENGISEQNDTSSSQGGDSNPIKTNAPAPVTEPNESHGIEDSAILSQNVIEEQSSEAMGSNKLMKQISDAANSDDRGCKDVADDDPQQDGAVSLKAEGSSGYKDVS